MADQIVVMIPTYNERDNLAELVEEVLAHEQVSIMVLDDQSPDGTGEIADELAARYPGRVDVVHRKGQRGLGRSYLEGIERALAGHARLICHMDADFSHDPKYLPDMIAAAEDHDLVIGSRYLRGVSVVNWPLHRIFLSAFANRYVRAITGLRVRDCTSGYRCWRREALEAIPRGQITSDGYSFQFEMVYEAARRGFRIAEVPIIFIERRLGQSKVSMPVLIESLITPWRLAVRNLVSPVPKR
jgi:dolichol-phosphate mannosyltransferase